MKKILYTLFAFILLAGIISSCSKESLDPTLAQSKAVESGISTVEDVYGLLYGAYTRITTTSYYGRDYIIWGEVRSDNCFSNGASGRFVGDARMDYTSTFGGCWTQCYRVIASANIVLGLDPQDFDNPAQVEHYQGQAYAIRAMAHFDLLRYYGQMHNGDSEGLGIPYIKEFKSENTKPARDPISQNKTDIYADISDAIAMMDPNYDNPSKEEFTQMGAYALWSRVALYFGDWGDCVTASNAVITSGDYSIIPASEYKNSFIIDGAANSIFELAYSSIDNNNINGLQQIYRGDAYGDVQGLQNLTDIFEATDVRGTVDGMIGEDPDVSGRFNVNLGKYPSYDYSDNIPIFRYEEVILNLAEALWRQNTSDGLTELNLIPAERNASAYAAINEDNILLERRKELCFEGMRFHDLARTGKDIPYPEPNLQTHEGPAYGTYKFAFPIPDVETDANANMAQNNGY
ncbi:MAG: RagB/SusD family nutrient uptake outer membrane protein [Bacteroidales bacterium]|nr:RagB/SusD family nutrient uptake outer membrane protein [Bacteroidales bacterium]